MWRADRLLDGYQSKEISLAELPTVNAEPNGSLRAVLVRRNPPKHRRAVLYIHGWNDYFFQTHMADFYASLGYDFYAIDLRRYGRSLVEGQYAGFVSSIEHYYTELDAAIEHIAGDHDQIVLSGHSTGGLVASLYAGDRPGVLAGLVLNSPWLEIQSAFIMHTISKAVLATLSSANPLYAIPVSDGFYLRTIDAQQDGEWIFDHNLKGDKAFKVRVGWFHAILAGQGRVALGLNIDCPVLVMTSKRHDFRKSWHDDLKTVDTVLDVDQIASRVTSLGDHVTLIRVDRGLHDLVLSPEPVRTEVFDHMGRWLRAYISSAIAD